jgi:hypothetical protein
VGQLFSVLLFAGFVIHYFRWITAGAAAVLALKWGRAAQAHHRELAEATAAERAAIAARADQQHRWALAGDPRGTYGGYPPGGVV